MVFKENISNVALIGAGYWGKNLARNFFELDALHTICDTNEALLDTYTDRYQGIALTTNFKSVLENPHIKRIVIAAPAFLHYKLAKQAIIANKDVYVEKPLCLDCQEAEELIHLAELHGRILMVGHLLQYHACVRKLLEIVGRGELGKLQYITSNRLNLGSYRTEENALWNFAPHDVSVILALCGHQLPEKIRCVGADYLSHGVADTSLTTMNFAGNVRAHIYVSWLNPFKEQKLTVVGSSGMAVFDDAKPWGEKLVLYRNHVTWAHGKIPIANKIDAECMDPPQEEPLKEECKHFLKCCDERLPALTNGEEGLRVLKVLQAAQASLNKDGEAFNPQEITRAQFVPEPYYIHPTAVVDPEAVLANDVKVWHYSHIMKGSKIGQGCNIGQNVFIASDVVLGKNVKVQNNVSIYAGIECEDDVFLGPSMVFTNIINPRSAVVRKGFYAKTLVKRGATIGANATIVCGITLGENSFVGAGAVVTKDLKPFALVVGNPAKQIGWMSRYGEKLDLPVCVKEGEEITATCPATGEVYCLRGDTLTLVNERELSLKPAEELISAN